MQARGTGCYTGLGVLRGGGVSYKRGWGVKGGVPVVSGARAHTRTQLLACADNNTHYKHAGHSLVPGEGALPYCQ